MPWAFDFSSLMVLLVGESDEQRYRLARRSLPEVLVATPVSGAPAYLRSYGFLRTHSDITYFSPYSGMTAPLRNMKLDNAIQQCSLLEGNNFAVFHVPDSVTRTVRSRTPMFFLWLWALFTWLCFGGIVVFWSLFSRTTWIGITTCAIFTGWSIILRLIEYVAIKPIYFNEHFATEPNEPDGAFMLGNSASAVVFEGSRSSIKHLMQGIYYQWRIFPVIPAPYFQAFTRTGTLLVLLMIFSCVPNGTTSDQVIFVLLNILAQINTMVGLYLNARCYLAELGLVMSTRPDSRVGIYGLLLRRFKDVDGGNWVQKAHLLPETLVWEEWRHAVLEDPDADPRKIFSDISNRFKRV